MQNQQASIGVLALNNLVKAQVKKFGEYQVKGSLKISSNGIATGYSGRYCRATLYDLVKTREYIETMFWNIDGKFPNIVNDADKTLIVCGQISLFGQKLQLTVNSYSVATEENTHESVRERNHKLALEHGLLNVPKKEIKYQDLKQIHLLLSLKGEVLHDINQNYGASPQLVQESVKVQGKECASSNVTKIEEINNAPDTDPSTDLIVLARGGGSEEDLDGYNDVKLLKAIVESSIPIVTALGHTQDCPLACIVSDRNFDTPTKFAMQVTQDIDSNLLKYKDFVKDLNIEIDKRIANVNHRIDTCKHELFLEKTKSQQSIERYISQLLNRLNIITSTEKFYIYENEGLVEIKTIDEFKALEGKQVTIPFSGGRCSIIFPKLESFQNFECEGAGKADIDSIRCELEEMLYRPSMKRQKITKSFDSYLADITKVKKKDIVRSMRNYLYDDLKKISRIEACIEASLEKYDSQEQVVKQLNFDAYKKYYKDSKDSKDSINCKTSNDYKNLTNLIDVIGHLYCLKQRFDESEKVKNVPDVSTLQVRDVIESYDRYKSFKNLAI